ncbi:MAG: dynamin family protein [Acidobacteriota bacterium]
MGSTGAADTSGASSVESLDAITDFKEHLKIVRELLERYVSEPRRAAFEHKIDSITRRVADPALNLAVIGEFSSGKSTFINGLLRSQLLKTASVATTAAVTRIRKGPALRVTALFGDDWTVAAVAEDFGELRRVLSALQPEAATDTSLKDLLHRLTSDPEVADRVRSIDIEFPAEELAEDLVILDTPGIGAGAETASNHARVTQWVVNEVADCALVLIPSANPMTSTLIEFLEEYARAFLHRCIFVVTAMDRQDEAERAETLAYVRSKLREKLGLESPTVFESAAVTMVPIARVPPSLQEAWPVWQSRFVALEASVRAALLRDRSLIIAERLIRLLQELLAEMERELGERQKTLETEAQVLRESTVTALEVVLEELQARSMKELEQTRRNVQVRCRQQHDTVAASTREWLHGLIETAGWDVKEYETKLHPQVSAGVEHYARHYTQTVDQELARLRACCDALAKGFARQFENSYQQLSSLGVAVSVPAVEVAAVPDPSAFGSALTHSAQQVGRDRRLDAAGGAVGCLALGWMGALPGALLGALLGGTIGGMFGDSVWTQFLNAIIWAVVGLGPGALCGLIATTRAGDSLGRKMAGAAGPKLEVRQKQLQSHLETDIAAFFEQASQRFEDHIDSVARAALTAFGTAVDRHKQEYGSTVERLRREHDRQQEAVAQKFAETRVASADLAQRAARLETTRRRLMRSSTAA